MKNLANQVHWILVREKFESGFGEIAKASPVRAKAARLHLLEGYSHKEVAQVLGISVAMSRQHTSRAYKFFEDYFGDWKAVRADYIGPDK